MIDIRNYTVSASDEVLDDLRRRLRETRWPEKEPVTDWSQGIPLAYLREFCAYWENGYDWKQREALLNLWPQFLAAIDGLDIHFLHVRSPESEAVPLILTHGWPGSIVEFQKVVGPLTNPVAHGGKPEDAVHLVCPSLPGFGFSGKPSSTGWGVEKIAATWNQMMIELGYPRYAAQGGDWGSAVTTAIGMHHGENCTAIHLNSPLALPTESAKKNPTEEDRRAFATIARYRNWETGYSTQQKTRPQTIGYSLVDSPAGLAGWVIEKFQAWSDCDGHPENVFSRDELIDNLMLYWLPACGASAARLYWESFDRAFAQEQKCVEIPTGCSIFPREIIQAPRSWAETRYPNIVYWNEVDKGGHFAAFEQPSLFVQEIRRWLRQTKPLMAG